jgi:hypothetical protein
LRKVTRAPWTPMFTILHDEEIHRLAPGASYLDCLRSMLEHVEMDRKKSKCAKGQRKERRSSHHQQKKTDMLHGLSQGR